MNFWRRLSFDINICNLKKNFNSESVLLISIPAFSNFLFPQTNTDISMTSSDELKKIEKTIHRYIISPSNKEKSVIRGDIETIEELEKDISKPIKSYLSSSCVNQQETQMRTDQIYFYIRDKLKKKPENLVIRRIYALLDYLFIRSQRFRFLLSDELSILVPNLLKPPTNGRKSANINHMNHYKYLTYIIKKWKSQFPHLKQLEVSLNYLEQVEASSQVAIVEDSEMEVREKVVKQVRARNFKQSVEDQRENLHKILENLDKMDGIISILMESDEFNLLTTNDNDLKYDYSNPDINDKSKYIRNNITINLDNSMENRLSMVQETSENTSLFSELRECLKLLITKHRKKVEKWSKSFAVYDEEYNSNPSRLEPDVDGRNLIGSKQDKQARLIEMIELSNRISSVIAMLEDLGIRTEHIIAEDDTEDLVEVPLFGEDSNDDEGSEDPSEDETNPTVKSSEKYPQKIQEPVALDSEHSDKEKSKLFEIAPVVEYDSDLYYWDKSKIQFNTTGLEFHHRFYGEGSGTNFLSEDTVNRLKTRSRFISDLKGRSHVKLRKCRFPLKNGKVCPRLHAEECTYHGKIIDRDGFGRPANVSSDGLTREEILKDFEEQRRQAEELEIEREVAAQLELRDFTKNKGKRKKDTAPKENVYRRISRKLNSSSSKRRIDDALNEEFSMRMRERQAHKW